MCAEAWPTQTSQARSGIRIGIGVKYFPWFQPSQFIHELDLCLCPLELCHPKLPGGDVQTGQPNDGLSLGRWGRGVGKGDSHQKMRFSRGKEFSVDQCARCIQTNDFAAHETLCEFRVFHLFAECDGPPSLKKLCDITLRGMVGHSQSGTGLVLDLSREVRAMESSLEAICASS